MGIERHQDPAEFFALVAPFLERREAEHNLQLGFRQRLEADRHAFGPGDPLLYAALDGRNVTAVATQTPPFGLVLSEVDDLRTVEALADRLAADGAELPTAMGPVEVARTFAERWAQRAGVLPSVQTAERIYEATAVVHPQGVSGAMQPYTESHREVAIDWMGAFFEEALPGSPEADPERFVEARAAGIGSLVLWEDDGRPVSIAGHAGETPKGARVGARVHAARVAGPRVCVGADRRSDGPAPRAVPVLLPVHRSREPDVELDLPADRVPHRHRSHALAVRRRLNPTATNSRVMPIAPARPAAR
jgi:hypothetical protein